MANSKGAKKRVKITAKRTLRNKIIRSRTKTATRRVMEAVSAGNAVAAQNALKNAMKTIDKAASKGVYHKNNASRKKATLSKLVNQVSA